MAAIRSLEIHKFRCFDELRIDGLASVNLIVGANNAGKTALLEAIEAVMSRESPFAGYRASLERGEVRRRRVGDEDVADLDVRHWFHSHELAAGVGFRLIATTDRSLALFRSLEPVQDHHAAPFIPGGLFLATERPGLSFSKDLPLTADGLLAAGPPDAFADHALRLTPPVGFVATHRLVAADLARLWADVVLTPGEQRTLDALRLIEPEIDRIAISDSDGARVLLRGAQGPVPLGSLGEGVSRILAIALHLARARGGTLLLDEIENGLHWSVMAKVWRFLVETSRKNNVQVFATTHSKDWLEGLADLHRAAPELAARVAVYRLEAGNPAAIRFEAGRIADYLTMELETR